METLVKVREGVLSSTGFPALIYSIMGQKETGILTLTGEMAEKSVYFQAGRPVYATSSDRDDRLSQVLLRAGIVSLEVLTGSLDESLHDRERLGKVLVKNGAIQPADLVDALKTQVGNIICSLFQWTRGFYRFTPGPVPAEEVVAVKLSPGNLVREGIRRIESWQRIWEAVGGLDAEYQLGGGVDEEEIKELQLSLEEWTLLAQCERRVTLRDLCRLSTMGDFEICRLIWALLTLGIVVRISPPA